MNRLRISIVATLLLTACSHKEDKNDETTIHARADSLVGIRMQELSQQAMEDLDQRMAIEVKAKADSIVAARTAGVKPAPSPVSVATKKTMDTVPALMRHPATSPTTNDTSRIR